MGCGASVPYDGFQAHPSSVFEAIEAGDAMRIRHLVAQNPQTAASCRNALGDTVLHHAAWKEPDGSASCMEALLEKPGVKHDMTNKAGWTALHMAAAHGKEPAMRALVRYGASCEATEPSGLTPLHLAAEYGHAGCIQAAVDCCLANLNAVDGKGRTPLHISARKGHLNCVEVLLRGSAVVNKATPDTSGGCTPLHEAAAPGYQEVAEALLKAKADLQARTSGGNTAAQIAAAAGHRALAAMLGASAKEEDLVSSKVAVASGGASYVEGDPEGLEPTSDSTRARVQHLMDETWKDVTTRDRGFTKVLHFEVVHVLQNSSKALWEAYRTRRDELSLHYVKRVADVKTAVESWDAGLQEPRNAAVNEFFLFHGTKPTAATSICGKGFNVDLSGSNKGSLYGPGVYCAESSAKADEYAQDDKDGLYKGLYAMLLCRVSLGNPAINEEVEPTIEAINRQFEADDMHSLIGDREKVRGTFREFVLRNPRQIYPAYAIIYRRKEK